MLVQGVKLRRCSALRTPVARVASIPTLAWREVRFLVPHDPEKVAEPVRDACILAPDYEAVSEGLLWITYFEPLRCMSCTVYGRVYPCT